MIALGFVADFTAKKRLRAALQWCSRLEEELAQLRREHDCG